MRRLSFLRYVSSIGLISLISVTLFATQAHAQGQDGTPAERNILIMSEMLPGTYSNANQSYFDFRLKAPLVERHASTIVKVEKAPVDVYGDYAFFVEFTEGKKDPDLFVYTLEVDAQKGVVRMKTYQRSADKKPVYLKGCDLLWRENAGQFTSDSASKTCTFSNRKGRYQAQLSESAFWLSFPKRAVGFYEMDQARNFNCYADVPGVGGGRDIPYERFQLDDVSDLGGEKWFTTKDGQEIGISLFRVIWKMNNYQDIFARPSFVIYAKTKKDGKKVEKGYAWTSPDAQRIGINLKWMLANCYLISNKDVTPFFKTNEPKEPLINYK